MRNRSGPGKEEKNHSTLPPRPHHTPAAGHSGTQMGLSLCGVLGAHSAALHQPVLDPPREPPPPRPLCCSDVGSASVEGHSERFPSDTGAGPTGPACDPEWTDPAPPRKTGHRPEGDAFQENPSEGSRVRSPEQEWPTPSLCTRARWDSGPRPGGHEGEKPVEPPWPPSAPHAGRAGKSAA